MALRVLVSLGFVLLMIDIVLNVVGTLQQALVTQAITDPLTGAFDRRHLQAQFDFMAAPPVAGAPLLRWPALRQRLAGSELLPGESVTGFA